MLAKALQKRHTWISVTRMQFRLVALYELMGTNLRLSCFQRTNLANGVSEWS